MVLLVDSRLRLSARAACAGDYDSQSGAMACGLAGGVMLAFISTNTNGMLDDEDSAAVRPTKCKT